MNLQYGKDLCHVLILSEEKHINIGKRPPSGRKIGLGLRDSGSGAGMTAVSTAVNQVTLDDRSGVLTIIFKLFSSRSGVLAITFHVFLFFCMAVEEGERNAERFLSGRKMILGLRDSGSGAGMTAVSTAVNQVTPDDRSGVLTIIFKLFSSRSGVLAITFHVFLFFCMAVEEGERNAERFLSGRKMILGLRDSGSAVGMTAVSTAVNQVTPDDRSGVLTIIFKLFSSRSGVLVITFHVFLFFCMAVEEGER